MRLRIYSWFMKYYHPKLASAGVIATFPVVTLVGANSSQVNHVIESLHPVQVYIPLGFVLHSSDQIKITTHKTRQMAVHNHVTKFREKLSFPLCLHWSIHID